MKKQKPSLYAYLGLEDGELALYCSTGRLNRAGTRLEKGTPLPADTFKVNEVNATSALRDLQDYFDKEASGEAMREVILALIAFALCYAWFLRAMM